MYEAQSRRRRRLPETRLKRPGQRIMRPHCQREKGVATKKGEMGEEKVADHIFPPPPERKKREKGPLSPLGYSSYTL